MKNEVLNSAHDPRKLCLDFHTLCHDLKFVHNTTVIHYCVMIYTLRATINVESKLPKLEPNRVTISSNHAAIFYEASTSILS